GGEWTADTLSAYLRQRPSNAQDQTTRTVYDAAGRPTYSIDPLGYVTERQYDAAGNVTGSVRYADKLEATLPR
ncbi:RHS repeat domain-containing protein, partial [Chromobacterium alticapitis]